MKNLIRGCTRGPMLAHMLIVHGRHWTEHYETPCRYDRLNFVNELKIPVIGNGDIACVSTLKKCLRLCWRYDCTFRRWAAVVNSSINR